MFIVLLFCVIYILLHDSNHCFNGFPVTLLVTTITSLYMTLLYSYSHNLTVPINVSDYLVFCLKNPSICAIWPYLSYFIFSN